MARRAVATGSSNKRFRHGISDQFPFRCQHLAAIDFPEQSELLKFTTLVWPIIQLG